MKLSKCKKKNKEKQTKINQKQTNKHTKHYNGILRHLQEYN